MSFLKEQYYPTPKPVTLKMLEGIKNLSDKTILEPSCGSGSILDVVLEICGNEHHYYGQPDYKKNWHCIEINVELQAILKDKGYTVIDNDFLNFYPEKHYDLVLANPPFDDGVKHLLHIIKVCEYSEIRCLLNAETINNPYTKERELLLDLIRQLKGNIIELGKCFQNSDRTTNVEVVLITIPAQERKTQFEFTGNSFGEKNFKIEDLQNNQLEKSDVIDSLVDRYTTSKRIFSEFLSKKLELEFYIKGLLYQGATIDDLLKNSFNNNCDTYYESFVENLKKECWKNILYKTKISDVITKSVRKDFTQFIEQQSNMAFSAENIESLFHTLMMNKGNIKEQCIISAFDHMTKFHKENRVHVEGWKTDSSYKVNKKVILPDVVEVNYSKKPSIRYYSREELTDIEKAMCFVAGKDYEKIKNNTIVTKILYQNLEFGTWYISEFFKFKVFKKGTLHMEFLDNYIHNQFNIMACKGKAWLPEQTNKSKVA